MFKCNCYVKQCERVNESHCNGRMHAVLNKSPTKMCLATTTKQKSEVYSREIHSALNPE